MLNDLFASELLQNDIEFEREFLAIPGRKFRFDFKIGKLLIDVQGGIWMRKGAHNTGKAIQRDCEKLNLAVLQGFDVMHFTTDDVEDGTAINMVLKYLEEK
jgi:very-short-patch-repair endonuclease